MVGGEVLTSAIAGKAGVRMAVVLSAVRGLEIGIGRWGDGAGK